MYAWLSVSYQNPENRSFVCTCTSHPFELVSRSAFVCTSQPLIWFVRPFVCTSPPKFAKVERSETKGEHSDQGHCRC